LAIPGLLLVDKPAGMTSHDVVAKVRKLAGTRKVGHAGTLDPMATGLLVLGIESATKLLTFVVGADKTYLATLRLGASTITDDREGEVIEQASPAQLGSISDESISAELSKLRGVIQQVPSAVSAIKVNGERAYDRVRAGEVFELKSREVTISKLEVLGQIRREENFIEIDIIVDCSSGTYIRAIARDLGSALGVGGHLTQLRRTRIGAFDVSDAITLDGTSTQALPIIQSVDAVKFLMPVIDSTTAQALAIRQGKRIIGEVDQVAALISSDELIAVVESAGTNSIKSLVVFNDGDSNG
jgi:tRNA pseudouridine55 synthase